jgi:hypothetical protein
MINICSFFQLPAQQQGGKVHSLANSWPNGVKVDGMILPLVPPWALVEEYKSGQLTEEGYTTRYRKHLVKNWPAVKRWLDSLDPNKDIYLCCWERTGFCHRFLVAKLIAKFRPDIELRVT